MSERSERNEAASEPTNSINDLSVAGEAEAIKGGPKKIFIGGLSVKDTQPALSDLEPQGEIKGGPALLIRKAG